MKFLTKILTVVAFITLFTGLSGCASNLIDVRAGSEQVSLLNTSQVTGCQSKGKIIVSVLANVGFISRSAEAIDANLLQLARNAAVDSNGDSIVRDGATVFGKATFSIYKCRH
jgi:hypothetical protein